MDRALAYFAAITSDRAFNRAMPVDEAVNVLWQEAGNALDPSVVSRYVHLLPSLQEGDDEARLVSARAGAVLSGGAGTVLASGGAARRTPAELLDGIGEASQELGALYEMAEAMGTSLGVSDTMAAIASKLDRLVPCTTVALYLHDPANGVSRCRFASGPGHRAFPGLLVRDGDKIEAGEPLTEGSLNPHRVLRIRGREACQLYLMAEIQKVYRSQGQNINDKHFEVIIRKMLSKVMITRPGDSKFLPGDLVDFLEIRNMNEKLLSQGKRPSRFIEQLLGITKASLSTDSFLSASSFQHTIKVLAGAAIASTEDPLYGLKENVIIGKLIPAGTGYAHGRFTDENGRERMTISTSVTNLPMSE